MEKWQLYYQNYETQTGTEKEFQKVTENLKRDIEPVTGTAKDVREFKPKIIRMHGRDGIYYLHQCLIAIEPNTYYDFIIDFIYKTIDDESTI